MQWTSRGYAPIVFMLGNAGPSASTGLVPRLIGLCFGCGEFDHLRHACKSATTVAGTSKPYPYINYIESCMSEMLSGELSMSEVLCVKCQYMMNLLNVGW